MAVCQIKFCTAVLDWLKLGLHVCFHRNAKSHLRINGSWGLIAGLSAVVQFLIGQGLASISVFLFTLVCTLMNVGNLFITHNIHQFNFWKAQLGQRTMLRNILYCDKWNSHCKSFCHYCVYMRGRSINGHSFTHPSYTYANKRGAYKTRINNGHWDQLTCNL